METGYFLVADVLGFSAMLANSSHTEFDARMSQWVELVEAATKKSGVDKFSLFSDTVFAAVPSTVEGANALINLSRLLLSEGLTNSFMVRGGIAHGTFTWGRVSYGRAIIDAHKLESRQNWVGIACQGKLPHAVELWGANRLVCYLPPMKSGLMQGQPVVSWDIPDATELIALAMKSNAVKDGEAIAWDVGEQLNNTLLFRSYLYVLQKENLDPSLFHGPLPSQALHEVLLKRAYR
ncbi:MAG: hypothetical protein NTW01_09895 [Gammaproteobacteria bacterium]|nr:hypothetical protein [Gammaproteobacteria bacterium]